MNTGDKRETFLSELVTPQMANFHGSLFGGALLALVDKAAYVCATRYCGSTCVTAGFDRVAFLQPVCIGELLQVHARVVSTGRTSVTVRIDVDAETIESGNHRRVFSCSVAMVAIREGVPIPVPGLVCESTEDLRDSFVAQHIRILEKEYAGKISRARISADEMNRDELQKAIDEMSRH